MKHLGSKIAQMGMRIKTNGFIARYYPKGFIAVHLQWLLVADLKGVYHSRQQLTPFLTNLPFHDFMLPKLRFWKTEQQIGRAFSKHFSRV